MPRPTLRLCPLETRDTPAAGFTAFGAAPGGQPLVAVVRPEGSTVAQFAAFETTFRGGVRAAAAELDGDPNTQEVVAAAGPGGGPAVKVFSVDLRTGGVSARSAFFAFEPTFTGGVRVAAGNVANRAGGLDQIVVGAGEGGGPRVRTVDISGTPIADSPLADFFAYEPSFRGGVQVSAGEIDGNTGSGDELVAAAGTGGGPRVRVIRTDGAVLADFFAFNPAFRGGANVVVTGTGGLVGRLRPDALLLDPSQRNQALNAAAVATTAGGVVASSTGVGTVLGGSVSNIGGSVNTLTGSVPDIRGATTAGGVGATTGAGDVSGATGQTGIGVSALGAGGFGVQGTGTGGITQATGAGDVGGRVTSSDVSANTSAGQISGRVNSTDVSAATGLGGGSVFAGGGSGVTQATGATNIQGGTLGNAAGGLATPTVTAFGPFGDPGQPLTTPTLSNPPFVPGRTRYTIPV